MSLPYDLLGTLKGDILDLLLEKLGYKVDPDEAEEIAEEVIHKTLEYIADSLNN
jgi:hypothetical protein